MAKAGHLSAPTHLAGSAHLAAAHCAAEQLAEQAGLLLAHLACDLGKIARILHPVIDAIAVHVRKADAALLCSLLEIAAQLHALLGRQAREGLLS